MSPFQSWHILQLLDQMKNSGLGNYIVPGLTSSLVGGEKNGKVRLFEQSRDTREFITPHSHRFDFAAIVLYGSVENTLFRLDRAGQPWCASAIDQVCGLDGLRKYVHIREEVPTFWIEETIQYAAGSTYKMDSTEIHSIKFSKGAVVLFFEGPQVTPTGRMLEPWVNGKCVPTFKTEPWMFEKLDG